MEVSMGHKVPIIEEKSKNKEAVPILIETAEYGMKKVPSLEDLSSGVLNQEISQYQLNRYNMTMKNG